MEEELAYLGTETEKCQIPTPTLKPTNGWTNSKISRGTDGSGREKNMISPKLAESEEDVGRFGGSQHD